jgi:HlyD family secretion protein
MPGFKRLSLSQNKLCPAPRTTAAGTVVQVSADQFVDKRTDQAYYAAKIRVHPGIAGINGVQIVRGMPAQVFITTGRGSVALYALRPLLDSFNNAFRAIEQRP